MKCPDCDHPIEIEETFGKECVPEDQRVLDLLGREIRSHRFGNCVNCWAMLDLVNGRLGATVLVPKMFVTSEGVEYVGTPIKAKR